MVERFQVISVSFLKCCFAEADEKYEKYEKDSELSKEVWKLKRQNQIPKITWKIRKKCKPFNPTSGKCDLCLNEKLLILELFDEIDLINKRDELVSKCRHQNKFKLNYEGGAKT